MTINRRRMLFGLTAAGGAVWLDPVEFLYRLSLGGRASAQNAGNSRRYILIQQPGAPARWLYDLFLNPGAQSIFQASPHFGTLYTGSDRYTGVRYDLPKIGGRALPPLWGFDLPAYGGGTVKLSSLLANLVHLRGIDTGNAGHPFCQRLHMRPLGARTTLTALPGDAGDNPLAAVAIATNTYEYTSLKSKSFVRVSTAGNPLTELLLPFTPAGDDAMKAASAESRDELVAVSRAMDKVLLSQQPESASQAQATIAARKMRERTLPDLAVEWDRLSKKYLALVERALRGTYPGVNDKPIGSTGTRGRESQLGGNILTEADLRSVVSTVKAEQLALGFALTEFIIVQDLSRSITVDPGYLTNTLGHGAPSSDEHQTGALLSLLFNTLFYAAQSACILELVRVLKEAGMWSDTVIDVAGEFNRKPRGDRSGSDHGFTAASIAIYTGAVTAGPLIIGDIVTGTADPTYPGTWGQGAANAGLDGAKLSMAHFAATLAMLLKVPSPVTAAASLLKQTGETYEAALPAGKIVAA